MARLSRAWMWGLAAILVARAAAAQEPSAFYADKTILFSVAANAGGGYDLYARTLARHMGRHIPGNPSISVQNIPGGGGMIAANGLYATAKRDGTAMGMIPSSLYLSAALGDPQARFDDLKFSFVGNMNEEVDTCSVWRTTGVRNAADLTKLDVVIGTTGVGSNSHTFPVAMNGVIGTRFKTVIGYPGFGRTTSMERGEIDGACGVFVSTLKTQYAPFVASGDMRVVLQMGLARHPDLPDIPNALELARDEDGRLTLQLLFAQLALGRPILGPPGVPEDRAKALAEAFDRTMADPAFVADAAKEGLETRWFGAGRMRETMEKMTRAPEAVKQRAREVLGMKG